MLKSALNKGEYDEWNTTSLSHILLSIRGLDMETSCPHVPSGPADGLRTHSSSDDEAHRFTNLLAENFLNWYRGRSYGCWEYFYRYTPRTGLEPFPSSTKIRAMITEANKFYTENKDKTRDEKILIMTGGQKLQ